MPACYTVAQIEFDPNIMNKIIAIRNLMNLILMLVGGIIIIRGEPKG